MKNKMTIKKKVASCLIALVALLSLNRFAFAAEQEGMKMENKSGGMSQENRMSGDEMIKKGEAMVAQGTAMKKKGMMQEEMKKGGMMKDDKMMKQNQTQENMNMKEEKMDDIKKMNK